MTFGLLLAGWLCLHRESCTGIYCGLCCFPWFEFYFSLFLGIIMCVIIKRLKQGKIKIKPRIKLNHSINYKLL